MLISISAIFFSVFSYPFLDRFSHLRHADFNGEHLSYLNKTNWPITFKAVSKVISNRHFTLHAKSLNFMHDADHFLPNN